MMLLSEHARNPTAALHQILRSPGDFDSERAAAVIEEAIKKATRGLDAGTRGG